MLITGKESGFETVTGFNSRHFGGRADTLALMGATSALMAANPALANMLPMSLVSGICAASGAWLGWRAMEALGLRSMLQSPTTAVSDAQRVKAKRGEHVENALFLGYTIDTGEPIWIDNGDAMRHVYIRGQSGVGKTVAASLLMFQQIQRGGGLLFIDGKIDADNLAMLHQMAVWAGRESDLEVINPGEPTTSNTYNPILFGDPDEVAARIIGLIPSTESSAGADHYKQSSNQGVSTLVAALQAAKLAYNFIDLTILLMSPKALDYLESQVPPEKPEATSLRIFLDQYRSGKDGAIDMKKLKDTFGGLGGRLYQFGTNKFGEVMNTYHPHVRLYESITHGKITYIALPTMGKDIAANNFGKMAIGDFRTAVSWIQSLPVKDRPNPPYMAFFDEAGSYVSATWSRLFEQARSAHIMLMPAVQTDANFAAVSDELSEMIEGNTWVKLFFKIGAQGTAENAAETIGKVRRVARTMTLTDSRSQSQAMMTPDPATSQSHGSGKSFAEREEEQHRISPDELKALDKGECIVMYGGDRVYPIKVPLLKVNDEFKKKLDRADVLNKPRNKHQFPRPRQGAVPYERGIRLFEQADRFLTSSDRETLANHADDR